jgi:hypothetical protein
VTRILADILHGVPFLSLAVHGLIRKDHNCEPASFRTRVKDVGTRFDLPCRGQEIARLTLAQLAMLLAKVARRVQDGADGWIPLLHALQGERQARIARARVTGTKKPRAMARRPWAVPDAAPPG